MHSSTGSPPLSNRAQRGQATSASIPASGAPPVDVSVELLMASFIDQSAVGGATGISKVAEQRKRRANELADLLSELKSASAERTPDGAITARVADLTKFPPG